MGLMRFVVPRRDHLLPNAVDRAYICGRDEVPWHARITATRDGVSIERAESDSGNFFVPWSVPGHGEIVLSTATLSERTEPYNLPLELARGTLNRLRLQAWAWESAGLVLPADFQRAAAESLSLLSRAVTSQYDPFLTSDRAQQAIASSLAAIQILVSAYAEQASSAKKLQAQRSIPLLGTNLGRWRPTEKVGRLLASTFNTANVSLSWRNVEAAEGKLNWERYDAQYDWCHANGLRVCGGPLIQIDQRFLPDWIYLWESDFENLLKLFGDFVGAAVQRYKTRTHLWHCTSGLNVGNAIALTDEQRLRLTVRALEATHTSDPRAPMVVSFRDPWGEYVANGTTDLTPLMFADTLARADLGISGLGLEINVREASTITAFRDELDLSRLVDRWSQLGLPLVVWLSIPSTDTSTEQTDQQSRWLRRYVPALLAKSLVHGILWSQFKDSAELDTPTSGLFDDNGSPKPAMDTLADLRQTYFT